MIQFPFSAIVGQDQLKAALVLAAVSPGMGGLLLRGEKGTAKSVAAHGLAGLLPAREPGQSPRVVEVPTGVSREELLGRVESPHSGLLARAHQGILFIGRVNLLPDPLLDATLEAQRTGINRIYERGHEVQHPSRFMLIATLSPEEGDLQAHHLDRFAISVAVEGIRELEARIEILDRCLQFERDPQAFVARFHADEERLAKRILSAREMLAEVTYSAEALHLAVNISTSVDTPGHRADLALLKAACALAALEELTEVGPPHIQGAASLVLPHRMRSSLTHDEPRLEDAVRRDYFTPTG